ncbi:TPA: DEAD/DEAH box helicase [Pseudomonas aeruginosa]|uniref:DEAD/DEAH box helicase n=1 Tax=Pseudomonas aeruginosa TaxID=287 RepID=UPI0004060308|nr:DEAD/DEAH box helicase [Pseudomonas aeruginosa]EIX9399513.1 DEAD/DEAH box helicase [Pseudomonas aeruginosa]MBN5481458.1 DEAD/DEAH box helicase [Pseudomonas aeruginosa]MCO3466223.1 DEAD/DEAH box helicase [Pseudomonas aeruginosa]MCO3477274.1 DEAD/DEAH box helicase [Pseudomonas aeruginosa]MCO3513013.1 DEAD/DEAH box helicase [Pseudomonas aeruginosa]
MITLQYDAEASVLLVSGADAGLIRRPLLQGYLKEHGGSVLPDQVISIPSTSDNLSARYQGLSKILQRFGYQLEAAGHASEMLEKVESEEKDFLEFSNRAAEIWDRKIETDEFKEFVSLVESSCPGRTFYRKQLLSAYHLAFSQHVCNFSVPGAGKTSILYAAYGYLKGLPLSNKKSINQLLIVGPLSSFKAWEDEYEQIFNRRPLMKRVSGGMPAVERSDFLRGITFGSRDVEVVLTSYQTLASSEEDFRVFLSRKDRRTMMVLDEAHYIKNVEGTWAAAALSLADHAAARVILTGTPAPNGYEDLYNLIKFIYPKKNIIGFPMPSLKAMSAGTMDRAIPELKSKIRPFYTRIKKADLGLPPAQDKIVIVEMESEQEEIYRKIERKIVPLLKIDREDSGSHVRVKARLMRLRQAAVNPELLLKPLEDERLLEVDTTEFSLDELKLAELIQGFDSSTSLARIKRCRELVERILTEQGKVLIWSYFLGNLEMLKDQLSDLAHFVEVLTGGTPVSSGDDDEYLIGTREEIIDRFHRESGRAILIANPQAVGESISLHKACRSAIYFDRDFNAGRYIQSKDRIHRYNPSGGEQVTYYHMIAPATVDESIDMRLTLKEQRLMDLVDTDDIPLFADPAADALDDITAIIESYEKRRAAVV